MASTPKKQSDAATAEEKAVRAHKEALKTDTDLMIAVAGGKLIPRDFFSIPSFAVQDPKSFLYEPQKLLKSPNPTSKYAWPAKSQASTEQNIRATRYRKVLAEELKDEADAEIKITTHKGVDDGVYWYDHVLVEITERAWAAIQSQAFVGAEKLARAEDKYKDEIYQKSGGKAIGSIEKHVS